MTQAAAQHKHVIIDFGGNWCGDCKVLDINLRKPENAALLKERYVVVHVNVGDKGIDHNFDVAERYGIPLKKGVPALAVLDSDGKVVYDFNGISADMWDAKEHSADERQSSRWTTFTERPFGAARGQRFPQSTPVGQPVPPPSK